MVFAATLILFLQNGVLQPRYDIVTRPAVQAEIRLAPGEAKKVQSIRSEADARLTAQLKRTHAAAGTTRENLVLTIARPRLQQLVRGLPAQQQRRLLEISLQESGSFVLDYPWMAETLGISKDRHAKIYDAQQKLAAAYRDRMLRFAKDHHLKMFGVKGGGEEPEWTPEIQAIEKQSEAARMATLLRMLTKTERNRLKRLLGEPSASAIRLRE
jgi:hypothetical protein